MVYAKRKDHENVGALLRRFSRRVQRSGILLEARKNRFYHSSPTKHAVRARALRRNRIRKERERLAKLGKLPEHRR